jgi:hypothetical protein
MPALPARVESIDRVAVCTSMKGLIIAESSTRVMVAALIV